MADRDPITRLKELDRAVDLHRQGQLAEALRLYEQILAVRPDDFDALHLGALAMFQSGDARGAADWIGRALGIRPDAVDALINSAAIFASLGRHGEALAACDRAITIAPGRFDGHYTRGNLLCQLGRFGEGIAAYDRVLAAQPRHVDAHVNRGNALRGLGRFDEALASFERVLAVDPRNVMALGNRANALLELGRTAEALTAYDDVLALQPGHADALRNRGSALGALGRPDEAVVGLDRALALRPGDAEAWFQRANALRALDRQQDALESYDRALSLRPDHAETLLNRGNALQALGRYEDALLSYDRALALRSDHPEIHNNRGNALHELRRYDAALASYGHALRLRPDHPNAMSQYVYLKRLMCDWDGLAGVEADLVSRACAGDLVMEPFPLLSLVDDPAVQLACARRYWRGRSVADAARPARARAETIRLGYISADFRLHPVAFQTAELFELHDRARFEVLGFAYGGPDDSAMRKRLRAAFDDFIALDGEDSRRVAERIQARGVDILIDLTGLTRGNRLDVLALRPAPVQVHYIGYPGTLGGGGIDYLIADPFIVPPGGEQHFAEKIVRLTPCYQVNDRQRQVGTRRWTRAECSLPDGGFVFCCFNNSYKLTPALFDVWMRLLGAVPGSVLWLLGDNPWVEANLRREAAARGVDPVRLVFAPRATPADHLARHALADLFLDTLPYNAHTTASDALWTGLPLITCAGRSFASRVAGSLLHAVDLPELVTHRLDDYESLALRLATEPGLLHSVRDRLVANRATAPLFDSVRTTRQIEAAYERMIERNRRGLPPESFGVGEKLKVSDVLGRHSFQHRSW